MAFTPTKYADFTLATGADDGTTKANAWQTLASMAAGMSAGDKIAAYGPVSISTAVDMTQAGHVGTLTAPIRICAFDSTLTTPTLGGVSINGNAVNYPLQFLTQSILEINGFEVYAGSTYQLYWTAGDGISLVNCYFHDGPGCISGSNESIHIEGCTFKTFSGHATTALGLVDVGRCLFTDIGGNGIDGTTGKSIRKNIFNDIGGNAVVIYGSTNLTTVIDNIFNLCTGSAIVGSGAGTAITIVAVYRNKFTNGSAYGMSLDNTFVVRGDYNLFYNNTSGEKNILGAYIGGDNDITASGDFYTNVGSLNFTPTASDEGAVSQLIGYSGDNINYTNIGAITPAAASGGGLLIHPGMNGGLRG